jgi:hypothetical protein
VEVRQVADLVEDHRAAVAAHVLVGAEHEVVDDELPASVEQVGEPCLAVPSVEHPVFLQTNPRQAAAFGGGARPAPLVAAFSLARIFCSAASHSCCDTTGGSFMWTLLWLRS